MRDVFLLDTIKAKIRFRELVRAVFYIRVRLYTNTYCTVLVWASVCAEMY